MEPEKKKSVLAAEYLTFLKNAIKIERGDLSVMKAEIAIKEAKIRALDHAQDTFMQYINKYE